jgi:hypothetical protein
MKKKEKKNQTSAHRDWFKFSGVMFLGARWYNAIARP